MTKRRFPQSAHIPRRWRRWLVQWAPLVITVSVIAVILTEVPPAEIARQVAQGTAWPLWLLALFSTLVTLVIVATADVLVLRACNDRAPVR